MRPTPWKKTCGNHNGWTPADGTPDKESRTRCRKYNKRIVRGNVDVSRIDRKDFNVPVVFDYRAVRVRP
jgi:hypothetical protein